jgi:hypothetical protein
MNLVPGDIPYGAGTWDSASLGNHRVVVEVVQQTEAVTVHIPWRRRDKEPQKKAVFITDAKTGKQVRNVIRLEINNEFGDLIFQPHTGPGRYYVYYMPYTTTGRKNYPTVEYVKSDIQAEKEWLGKYLPVKTKLPQAKVLEIQSIDTFNSFYPMELVATKQEVESLLAKHKDKTYLLFPETRENPIRVTDHLPYKWIKSGVQSLQVGEAARGEFYAFQVGVYAKDSALKNISARYSDLKGMNGVIPASALRCFNLGGVDWTGQTFKKTCPVARGKVQPLWFGVQVPEDIGPGTYEGIVTLAPTGMTAQQVRLRLKVRKETLADSGDSEPRRHSRLRWLDSKIALDYKIVPPFTNMRIGKQGKHTIIACLGRILTIGDTGLPAGIHSKFNSGVTRIVSGQGREILANGITLKVEDTNGNVLIWKPGKFTITRRSPGAVGWKQVSTTAAGVLEMECSAQMEFDGFVGFDIAVRAKKTVTVNDIRLEIPYKEDVARYMMGLGLKGGFRPAAFQWKWDVKKNQDGAWIGDVNAGLQYSLRGSNYSRPLNTNFYHLKPLNMPVSWFNKGKGGIDMKSKDAATLMVKAYSGARTIEAGQVLHFDFNLLITPFKPLDTAKQWSHRFFHRFKPLEEIAAAGANTVNVHHATEINPFINYPFIRPRQMKAYVDRAHEMGMKVKIYYTVRELSNIAPEMFALRSLGDEILSYGPGGGFAWLQEHLGGNYIAGWLVPRYKDAAVINSGVSRWHNYYLEGLNWLVKNVGIDGLYIDDVAFDRTVMKRVRKILDRGRKGALIDLHSANQYNPRDGFANSANLYLEHFPYIDRLWFGEYFDYDSQPDFWLVEVSGIPFGLMGEMLQDGGNAWRGMVYGMTSRLPWAGDPSPLWKAWDDFGIQKSRMYGYWSTDCPLKTGRSDVLVTAYVITGKKTLAALASWAKEDTRCKLFIDWNALGLNPENVRITAPAIKDFQPAAVFKIKDDIPVSKGKGWLLIIEEGH